VLRLQRIESTEPGEVAPCTWTTGERIWIFAGIVMLGFVVIPLLVSALL